MEGISDQEFLQKNLLHISSIEEGFRKYEYAILSGTEKNYREFIECALSMNGEENSYFDCYYSRLEEKGKEKFRENLTPSEKENLADMEHTQAVYYPLTEEWIPLISRVTARGILFSTFYFGKYLCTLWGNYGLRYPIFFKDKKIRKIYEGAARACGLNVE